MNEELDNITTEISNLIEFREKYQRKVGELAAQAASKYGPKSLISIASQIEETAGRPFSVGTLRNYRWVYEKTKDLGIPEDIGWWVCQHIAGTDDPRYWADKIINEGLSGGAVVKQIMSDKAKNGKTKKEYRVTCPKCGHDFYHER